MKNKKLRKLITAVLYAFTSGWKKVVLLILCYFSSNIMVLLQERGNAFFKKNILTVFSENNTNGFLMIHAYN